MSTVIMKAQCATCPFRDEGWTDVRSLLEKRALTEATPLCHSTGPKALSKRISKKALGCRGARDFQLKIFFAMRFIEAPTDQAWEKKAKELSL